MKNIIRMAAIGSVAVLALTACGSAPEESPATGGSTTEASSSPSESAGGATSDFKACMVSDSGGFEDKSFNQSGKEGLDRVVADLGIQEATAESTADTDFTPNITNMLAQNCNLIIGVGFLLEDAIQTAADANPDVDFALVDSSFTDADFNVVEVPNGKPLLFNTQEAAFLAGYVAAGTTKTGTVATFGGQKIPSVTIFMDGFVDGVAQYNADNGSNVNVLGWNKDSQDGSFTGDFEDQSKGQNTAKAFIDQNADIIMPVAGPVGLGAAAAAKDAGNVMIIGVDADWYQSAPDYSSIILTSVIKEIGQSVYDTVKAASEGSFSAEPYVGTLENGGIDIAPFHDFDSQVPAELKSKVDDLKQQIISGELKVDSPSAN